MNCYEFYGTLINFFPRDLILIIETYIDLDTLCDWDPGYVSRENHIPGIILLRLSEIINRFNHLDTFLS